MRPLARRATKAETFVENYSIMVDDDEDENYSMVVDDEDDDNW